MNDFKQSLTLNDILYQFSFTAIQNPQAKKYFVEVSCPLAEGFVFEMKQEPYHDWKVVAPAFDWIVELEPLLAGMIEKHNSGNENQ